MWFCGNDRGNIASWGFNLSLCLSFRARFHRKCAGHQGRCNLVILNFLVLCSIPSYILLEDICYFTYLVALFFQGVLAKEEPSCIWWLTIQECIFFLKRHFHSIPDHKGRLEGGSYGGSTYSVESSLGGVPWPCNHSHSSSALTFHKSSWHSWSMFTSSTSFEAICLYQLDCKSW